MPHGSFTGLKRIRLLVEASLLSLVLATGGALALSEIKPDAPAPAEGETTTAPAPEATPRVPGVPLPDPVGRPAAPTGEQPPAEAPAGDEADPVGEPATDPTRPDIDPNAPLPEIVYDMSRLPEPVKRMRDLILEATRSGDIEKLRPLLGTGDGATQLSFGGVDGDLIEFLKQNSGDGQGQEILAILEEVLEAGYVHLDAGKPEELYVWPYFFAIPLDRLTLPQRVELFHIITGGDYEDMKNFGAYIFYRAGITPDGRWRFFVSGD